ncbi:MAG: reverse transcriptase/maturase family protein [Patescibacteria group bacterium]|nr:reverse transcriptase/maturase family protein [Patescibacteria group bacterium]
MKSQLSHKFEDIINLDNLLEAWQEFLRGKRSRKDVQIFSANLMDNIFSLHHDLLYHAYEHGGYEAFKINDPKPRDIHKAGVRDRLLHHAVYRILYPFFVRTFIADSYSCQINKGTHCALDKFRRFAYQASKNNTRTCYVLKGDIRKFFASIDQNILLKILNEYIPDKNIIWLLEKIIKSFSAKANGVGLPLGNLTSQLFVNIYLNKFDQFIKHKLKVKYYIRYADDFVIFSENKKWLEDLIPAIRKFLRDELKLELHPDKVFIKTIASGVDFLGMVNFPDHRILRVKTKRRMLKRLSAGRGQLRSGLISEEKFKQSRQSYLGMLKHCRGYKINRRIG